VDATPLAAHSGVERFRSSQAWRLITLTQQGEGCHWVLPNHTSTLAVVGLFVAITMLLD
jgi:hypothetical protein